MSSGRFFKTVVPRVRLFCLIFLARFATLCWHQLSRSMYFRKKTTGGRAYLQIVESRREGARVRQQVIATLGRYDELSESGQLERLLRSGARFAAKAILISAQQEDAPTTAHVRRI